MVYLIVLDMVYAIGKLFIPPLYNLWVGKINGLKNVPRDKSFIIAVNHSSYYETLLPYTILTPLLNKQIHALVNSRYYCNPLLELFLAWGKSLPVFVGKDYDEKKNLQSIDKASNFLKKGDLIQIFPEGTRSYDGRLKKGYTGVAKLAMMAKVPVLPMGVIGSNNVLPKGKIFPRFVKCDVKFGNLMSFERYYNKKIGDKILEKITREIMKEIAKLINQEYNY